ncbi:MAG: MFS transporter [Alphaproteobacteria bacterium]
MSSVSLSIQPQVRIMGLVGAGHMMSHFYSNTLPPLLPFLNSDLGIGYTMLGAMLSLRGMLTAGLQVPAGALVDRFGAKTLLIVGLAMCAIGTIMTAGAGGIWMLLFAGIVLGVGNSVFHPADYTILGGTMDERYMGRAFSLHAFFGHVGSAIAPIVLIAITALSSWRTALLVAGIVGLVILVGLISQWRYIGEDAAAAAGPKKKKKVEAEAEDPNAPQTTGQLLRYIATSPAILFLFLYYAMNQLAGGGLKTFAVAGLVETHDTAATLANAAFTTFLATNAAGVLFGGWLADVTKRAELMAAIGLGLSAVVMTFIGLWSLPGFLLIAIFAFAGLTNGIIGPARDLLVRRASPKGSMGKVFGFVFSGQAIGGALAPLLFGFMIDVGAPAWIFYGSAFFTILCMIVVLISARHSRPA